MALIQILTDKSRMPFGRYKGAEMGKVPADYLLWLSGQPKRNDAASKGVHEYINDNIDVLRVQVKRERNHLFNPYQ